MHVCTLNLSRYTIPLLHGNNRLLPVGRLCSPDDVLYYHCSVLSVINEVYWVFPPTNSCDCFPAPLVSVTPSESVGVDAYVLSVLTDDVGLGFSDDVSVGTFDVVGHWFPDIGPFPPLTVSAIRASKGTRCSYINFSKINMERKILMGMEKSQVVKIYHYHSR